jgi:hypothetical protein
MAAVLQIVRVQAAQDRHLQLQVLQLLMRGAVVRALLKAAAALALAEQAAAAQAAQRLAQ